MSILIVIPYCQADAEQAETLIDFIRQLNGNKAEGAVLLAAQNDVHPEMQAKLRIAAEMAFVDVDQFQAGPNSKAESKTDRVAWLLSETAKVIATRYRWPFFWCEPDCVPLKATWRNDLEMHYECQGKLFMGPMMMFNKVIVMGRVAVYPPNAINFLGQMNRGTKTREIQYGAFAETDTLEKVWPEAVIYHGDKAWRLMELVKQSRPNPDWVDAPVPEGVPTTIGDAQRFIADGDTLKPFPTEAPPDPGVKMIGSAEDFKAVPATVPPKPARKGAAKAPLIPPNADTPFHQHPDSPPPVQRWGKSREAETA